MTIRAYTNAKGYGVYCRARASAVSHELYRSMEVAGNDLLRRARKLSSGSVSYAVMRRMDHPYAKRHGGPKLNPAIINRHRGRYRAGWKKKITVTPGRKGGEGVTVKLSNNSDVAPYLARAGTPGSKSKMVQRPIIREIIKSALPEHRKEIRRATRKAYGTPYRGRGQATGAAAIGRAFLDGVRRGESLAGAGMSGLAL